MLKEDKGILHKLYVELVKLQKEIIASNLKLLIILEGRDAAGKDGTIKTIIKHLNQLDYHNKHKGLVSHDYKLVCHATPENIKEKCF